MPASNTILKTKLYPPQPTLDFVERKVLDNKFENLKHIPVMLVSASTGYGKSTLVANFLSMQSDNYAWLSLSDKENEFQEFIKYFIAAVQSKVHNFGEEVLELARAQQPPSIEELADLLLNEIAELENHFYLAIDDYHLIRNADIHQFIAKLFEYPQPFFRIIIITRRDPGLPLSIWRSKNKLIEIRSPDLKFNRNEIAEFYSKVLNNQADENILTLLEEVSEGWISGLRLMMLSSHNYDELQQQFSHLNFKSNRIIKELIDATLKNQTEVTKKRLIRLSLLKEFNVELFSALCLNEDEKNNEKDLFNEFISSIVRSNLFIVALDDKHNWFRFHHLFTEQLYEVLLIEYDEQSISDLRLKVADWYSNNNFPEEAIEFYLAANKFESALKVFSGYKLKLISDSQFGQLERVFNLFPDQLVEEHAVLLLAKAWVYYYKGNIAQFAKMCDPIEQLLENEKHDQYEQELLLGEVFTLKAYDLYLGEINMEACIDYTKKAIELLRNKNPYAYGLAWIFYGGALHILESTDIAKKEVLRELETCTIPAMRAQFLLILWYIDWFNADFKNSLKIASQLMELGTESEQKMALAHGNGFTGAANFNLYKNDKAIPYLNEATDLKYYSIQAVGFPPIIMLTKIHAEKGNQADMERLIQISEKDAYKGGKRFVKIMEALNADIGWNMNRDSSALKWAKENDYKDFLPLLSFYNPEITQAKILALDDEESSLRLSLKILDQLIPFFEKRSNINCMIQSYVVKALALYKLGNTEDGYGILQCTLELSAPRNFIRPYVELGDHMKSMLQECKKTSKHLHHIEEILKCFNGATKEREEILLSPREKEILITAENMTNKEVGNKLFISEKTVKTHITNINKKLDVKSKSEAISKAKELALI